MSAQKDVTIPPEGTFPVFVHRWFRSGAGWAYHPSLQGEIRTLIGAVDRPLKSGGNDEKGAVATSNREAWLVFVKRPDFNCQDPASKNRSPFYFATAVVREALFPLDLKILQDQLLQMPDVEQEGERAELLVEDKRPGKA